ncbi:hypothetical protein B0H12DRAFT_1241973 [Mycena haematopus]|nr:hypothetical protein B0H12DRAFT_1241973 [Mycena haematopus]
MSNPVVPTSTTILVIGGGPAGAYTAAALAREGFSVTVLEKDHFPRYHIGESLLASCRPFLRFIDADEKVASHGFALKVGAAVKLNRSKLEAYTDFIGGDLGNAPWNVERSEFDEILLRHAAESGARICEGVQITGISFSPDDEKRPVSAQWKSDVGSEGEVCFDWLVDASGRTGIMSSKYLKNRKFNPALKNIAFWSYWSGAGKYGVGTTRENSSFFEALTGDIGWAWFIPLSGTVSVGVILKDEVSRVKKSALKGPDANKTHYLTLLNLAPGIIRLLGDAKLADEVKSAADYSYSASQYAGPNYRITGDAGGNIRELSSIDPFFSSGVHLAFTSGLSAAVAIGFHNSKTERSYTRFLFAVLSVYRQISARPAPILSDIDEDTGNSGRASDSIRPIIHWQGTADVDQIITQETLLGTMDLDENVQGLTIVLEHGELGLRRSSDPKAGQ